MMNQTIFETFNESIKYKLYSDAVIAANTTEFFVMGFSIIIGIAIFVYLIGYAWPYLSDKFSKTKAAKLEMLETKRELDLKQIKSLEEKLTTTTAKLQKLQDYVAFISKTVNPAEASNEKKN